MKVLRRLAAAAAVVLCLGGVPAAAQDTGGMRSDILVLDPERIFEESQLGKRMLADHQAAREELAARNRKLEAELEAEERDLTEQRAKLSPEEFRRLADDFDARVQDIRRDSERRVRDLERERDRLPVTFLRRAEPVLIALMRDMGGLVLLDARTVLLRADPVDITDEAIARIDDAGGDGEPGGDGPDDAQPPAPPEAEHGDTQEAPAQ